MSKTSRKSSRSHSTQSSHNPGAKRNRPETTTRWMQSFQEPLRGGHILAGDLQRGLTNMADMTLRFMPVAGQQMRQAMNLVATNSRAGAELMNKTIEAMQTPTIAESQSKWIDVWATSVKAAQCNAEAITRMSTEALDCWLEMFRENTRERDGEQSHAE